jgi:Protein of unknown function (DUF4238)
MQKQQSHTHHYVPQWYQRRFLKDGQSTFHYLDVRPDILNNNGVKYQRRALLHWGPGRCFFKDNLYTVKLGGWTTDEVERRFFGMIDSRGRKAVELFGEYAGYGEGVNEAAQDLPQYMDAQYFRTPRGLDFLKASTDIQDDNQTLLFMQMAFQFHTTMWTEGVWEIVRSRDSATKFIVTDEPVTFFNRRVFPSELVYPNDVGLEKIGTRTIFPLGLDSCLIITHTQLVRNPWAIPTSSRVNARAYKQTMKNLLDTQFGRELEEDEVIRINFMLKKRANRYIAAAEEEWLFPERHASTTNWSKLDDDWFLFPHLYKVPFSGGIMVGWKDGSSWAMDEYGRNPADPKYQDKKLHDEEWITRQEAQKAWAKKRAGRSVAHVDKFRGNEQVGDKLMQDFLSGIEG